MSLTRSLALGAILATVLATPTLAQTGCPIQWSGQPCRAELDARSFEFAGEWHLELTARSSQPFALGVLVFGGTMLNLPLPIQNCPLLASPDLVLPIQTNSRGLAQTTIRAPISGTTGFATQAIVIESTMPLDFGTSRAALLRQRGSGEHVVLPLTSSLVDPQRSTVQSASSWRPVVLGGSGVLGDFDVSLLPTAGTDAKGRTIHVWNSDALLVPGTHTLTGQDILVTGAIYEFSSFVVPSTANVVLRGMRPVEIHVAGPVQIDGVLDVSAPAMTKQLPDPRDGGAGGPGGARGGYGGTSNGQPNGSLDGQHGSDLVLPSAHPKGTAPLTGGAGSRANPASGQNRDVVWVKISNQSIFVRMSAAGGAGGAFLSPGGQGTAFAQGVNQYGPIVPAELGAATPGSAAFSLTPISTQIASRAQFLIGGAGGGGGGTDPFGSITPTVFWNHGAGGGGGGGALQLSSGRDVVLGGQGELLALGGDAVDFGNRSSVPYPAPGGGGSGGSLLLQCVQSPQLLGRVDLSGGQGGFMTETAYGLGVAARGGAGGAGLLRVEAPQRPDETKWTNVTPPPAALNAGTLLALDHRPTSLVTSNWQKLQRTPGRVRFDTYLLRGFANGAPFVLSNDPRLAARAATPGQDVVLSVQSAVDSGNQPGARTPWQTGGLEVLSRHANVGPWFRFAVRFDSRGGSLPADFRLDQFELWTSCE